MTTLTTPIVLFISRIFAALIFFNTAKNMVKLNKSKSATRGTKSEQHVRLGSAKILSQKEINARYPISPEAQNLIDGLRAGIDESSVYYLTDCFRGFSFEMQREMVVFFLDALIGRIEGKELLSFTGVKHVDLLLLSVLDKMDHDTKNIEDNAC